MAKTLLEIDFGTNCTLGKALFYSKKNSTEEPVTQLSRPLRRQNGCHIPRQEVDV